MPDVAFIIDTPTQLAATDGPPRSRIQVAQLGRYQDPRYGAFSITAQEVANWQKLLAGYFGGRVPIDEDHATDKGGRSEAQGWILGLEREGNAVFADVEWTPVGEAAIRDKRYLYISPTFVSDFKDQQGNGLGPALLRAGLTNNPFLRQMPAVSLSAIATEQVTLLGQAMTSAAEAGLHLAVPNPPDPDSRPVMPDLLKTLAKLHGLPEDADEAKVLEAATNAKTAADAKPPESTDTKTLEARAADEGKVLLDAAQVTKLTEDAAKGVKAEQDLAVMTFENAYTAALKSGRIDAKPETKQLHESIFAVDREKSIKLLQSLPEGVVNLSAHGEGGDHDEPVTTLDGQTVDPESVKLDKQVKARMADKGEDYPTALSAVLSADESMVL